MPGSRSGGMQQEPAHRFDRIERPGLLDRVLEVPTGHRGNVSDQHRPAARIGDVGVELREVGEHRRVEVEQTLVHGEAAAVEVKLLLRE